MVGRKGTCYEERRKKTLEENKKRMEQLNLNKLSQSLCKPKKVQPRPTRQPINLSLVRRSTRVADIREKYAETIAQKKLNEDLTNSGALRRPPSAFFIFMEAFRKKLFKKYFPENKSVAAVGKAAGKEWRSMSDSDKAPYVAKAAKKKADYEKAKKHAETIAQKKLNEDLTKDDSSDDSDSQVKNSGSLRRPPSAFFVFMEEFRNLFKQRFPENKSVAAVGKAAGEEWRSMSDSDKAPYVARAAKKKADYEKAKEELKNKTNGNGSTSTVFEKSSSEVHDEAEHERPLLENLEQHFYSCRDFVVRKIYERRVLKQQRNMGHKPDDIKGGEGSIKVGATGRVSALMIRELEDCNSVSRKRNPKSVPVSVCCGASASSNKAGSRSNNTVQRTQGNIQGKMHSYHIPMLASQDISVDKSPPVRGKLENKRSKLVEIVDLKCGRKPGKVCSSPISKKLNFSRLPVSH